MKLLLLFIFATLFQDYECAPHTVSPQARSALTTFLDTKEGEASAAEAAEARAALAEILTGKSAIEDPSQSNDAAVAKARAIIDYVKKARSLNEARSAARAKARGVSNLIQDGNKPASDFPAARSSIPDPYAVLD